MKTSDYKKIKPLSSPAELFDLSGRVGLILGGAGKMGWQFASTFVQAGAKVILADLNPEALSQAVEQIRVKTGKKPETAAVDASSAKELDELFGTLEKNHDRLDFLICNMMAKPEGYYRPFPEYSLEIWNRVLEVNLTGVFLACQRASRLMKKRKNGSIVLTSSVYGLVSPDFRIYRHCSPQKNPYGGSEPLTAPVAYTASKGGIAALTRYLAVFLGPDGIRVNTLTPGGVYDGHEEEFHKAYVKKTPIGRMAVWSDYNGAALFLVSDASRYMTGANLVIDGGWTAW